jgi:membrane protein required for colicin V production
MNTFDILLAVLVVVSVIAGFVRGLLRELIALLSWVIGFLLSWTYAEQLEPYLGGLLAQAGLRLWAARVLIFVAVLIAGTLIGGIVTMFVRLSLFSPLDRSLGGLFGLLRSAVVVGLLMIGGHALRMDRESWWRGSILAPYAEHPANVLRALVGERKIEP